MSQDKIVVGAGQPITGRFAFAGKHINDGLADCLEDADPSVRANAASALEQAPGVATLVAERLVKMKTGDSSRLAARILEQEHKIYPRAVQLFAEGRLRVDGRRVYIEQGKPVGEAIISAS